MKQLIYIAVLLMASGLAACQKDEIEGENGVGDGVALTFASGVDGLTAEALAEEAGNVHLLVFDEAGTFVSREEYAGLDETSPVKLSLGSYTFAYVTNVAAGAIGGATEGAALGDVTVSLPMDENGEYVAAAFLTTCSQLDMGDAIVTGMLDSFDIPYVKKFPHYGGFGNLMLGISAEGVDIFVPETMLEDARNILEGESEDEEEL